MITKRDVLDLLGKCENLPSGELIPFATEQGLPIFIRLLQVLTERLPEDAFMESAKGVSESDFLRWQNEQE